MDLYNKNDFDRPGTPASGEELKKAIHKFCLNGCFIPETLKNRWYLDKDRGKLVYIGNSNPEQKSD